MQHPTLVTALGTVSGLGVRRIFRHVVEIPAPREGASQQINDMVRWCSSRLTARDWISETRHDGRSSYTQFRFTSPSMADQFAECFRRAGPVRYRS